MNKRFLKILIAGMVCFCMTLTPVFGLEEELQTEQQDVQQTTQEQQPEEITESEISEQTEVIEEDMKFLYVESKQLSTPGTQNIAVGWKDDINLASNIVLLVKNPAGNTVEIPETNRTEKSVLFTKDFQAGTEGSYEILGVRYNVGEATEHFEFDDVNIDATFKVVEGLDELAVIDIENSKVDKAEAAEEIGDAIGDAGDDSVSIQSLQPRNGKSFVVMLDPGHSGSDVGAVNKTLGLNEKTVNYKIAEYCKAELEEYSGIQVYYTYPKGGTTDLSKRVKAAVDKNADLFVSLHCNAINGSVRGSEIYYPNTTGGNDNFNAEGKSLSNAIRNQLKALGITDRGLLTRNSSDYPGKDYYHVIRESRAKGILGIIVEHCYIDNYNDAKAFLSDNEKLKALGCADAYGIAQYLRLSKLHFNEDGKVEGSDGEILTSQWVVVDNNLYRLDEAGDVVKGFWTDEQTENKYYLNEETGIAESNKFIRSGGNRYYVQEDGLLATGVNTVDGNSFFFNNEVDIEDESYGAVFKLETEQENVVSKVIGDAEYCICTDGRLCMFKAKAKVTSYARKGAGTKFSRYGKVKKGTTLYVMKKKGNWLLMDDGRWVSQRFIKKLEVYPIVTPILYDKMKLGKLTAKTIGKSGPGTNYISKTTYASGKVLEIAGEYGDWYYLKNEKWVPKSKVTDVGEYGESPNKSWTFYRSAKITCSGGYLRGADISTYQGDVNWSKVANAVANHQLDFVILRCAGSPVTNGHAKDDSRWKTNVQACERYNIPYGVYLRSFAGTDSEAAADAQQALRLLEGHSPQLPVYYDLESDETLNALSSKTAAQKKTAITGFAEIFCEAMTENGYDAGVYANLNWFTNYVNGDALKAQGYDLWLAQWPTANKTYSSYNYGNKYSIWQVCSVGNKSGYTHVPGVTGAVDLDLMVVPASYFDLQKQ